MRAPGAWQEANQAGLVAALRPIHAALLRYTGSEDDTARLEVSAERVECDTVNALCTLFELSGFERATLLLCAGVELEGRFARACAAANGDPKRGHATFALALAALPARIGARSAGNSLCATGVLLDVLPGDTLAVSQLKIDERILHYWSASTAWTNGSTASCTGCRRRNHPPICCRPLPRSRA